MTARILATLSTLIVAFWLGGCTVVVRQVPTPTYEPQFSQRAELPRLPPNAYLQRGSGCRLEDASYRSDSRSTMGVRVEVEDCNWRQGNQVCSSRSKFTTYIGKDQPFGAIPETMLEKTSECTWDNGRSECSRRVRESAKLVPNIVSGRLVSYIKHHLRQPAETYRCR